MIKNKILIGYMGVGKSYICKKIATISGINCIDLDEQIEKETNMPINDIFKLKGEDYFRALENKILSDIISNKKNYIISCGGGTPCFKDNIELMNKAAITIYLRDSTNNIYKRLLEEKSKRPLIKDLKKKELFEFIDKNIKAREKFYQKAKVIINLDKLKADEVINYIISL